MAVAPSNAFQSGDDFISFDLGSPPPPPADNTPGPSREKGKAKAADTPNSSNNGSGKPKERGKPKKNGKAYKGSSKKRKAMEELEEDDTPISTSRRDELENCPWAEFVDWEGCRDPAEM
jgi:hypothetical protein